MLLNQHWAAVSCHLILDRTKLFLIALRWLANAVKLTSCRLADDLPVEQPRSGASLPDSCDDGVLLSESTAQQLRRNVVLLEETACTSKEELGWLGRETCLPTGEDSSSAHSSLEQQSSCSVALLVKCVTCNQVVLQSRFHVHRQRCAARLRHKERQTAKQQAQWAQGGSRPVTPPVSGSTKPAAAKLLKQEARKSKSSKQRQPSRLGNPHQAMSPSLGAHAAGLPPGTLHPLAAADLSGKPPLPRGRPQSSLHIPPRSPMLYSALSPGFASDPGPVFDSISPSPLLPPSAMASPDAKVLGCMSGGGGAFHHPSLLAAHMKRPRSATPPR